MRQWYEEHKDNPTTPEYQEYKSLSDECYELGNDKHYRLNKKDIKAMKKWIAEHKDDEMGEG